jgi:hypothetical protein
VRLDATVKAPRTGPQDHGETMNNDNPVLWIILGLAALAIVVIAAIAMRRRARMQNAELRERFGPEYQRAVGEYGSESRAEHELAKRARRVDRLQFRDLTAAERTRFEAAWSALQAQFVDDPIRAAAGANQLITEVMRARGYPIEDFDTRAADLSVDHPAVVQHYRAARALAQSSGHEMGSTEDLRQAIVHYRALFAELLQNTPVPTVHTLREAHG